MKLDAFVKVTLVIIAVFLGIIVLRPFFEIGSASANPSRKFDYVQFSYRHIDPIGIAFFDTITGDIWGYRIDSPGKLYHVGRLVELGKPLQEQK